MAAGRFGKAPGGLRRPLEGLSDIFRAWNATLEFAKKFTEECFAQHVDGAPSTAPSSVNFFGSESRPAGQKWCEALFP